MHAPVARPQHGLVCDSGVVSGAEEWVMTTTRNGAQMRCLITLARDRTRQLRDFYELL